MIYEFQATQSFNGYDKPWAPGAGKNLLPNDYVTATDNGVTYTVHDDGTVTTSGTATADSVFMLISSTDLISYLENGKTYTVSGCPSGGSATTYYMYLNVTGTTDTGSGANVTFQGAGLGNLTIRAKSGTNMNGKVFKPMVCLSTESDPTTFAPYENICPPEGFNIWDPYNDEFIQVYAGYVNSNTRELYLRPVYEEYDGEELVGPWMSSMDAYSEEATPTTGAFVIDFGGELTSFEITPFMLQTLLDSLGIRQHFTNGAGLLNSLMDQAQGRVRSEEELLHLSRPLNVIAIGDQLPAGLHIRPISKDVLPGLPGKFIR